MMTEDWINEAFENARRECDTAMPIAMRISEFLDANAPKILDMWQRQVGQERSVKMAVVISQNERFSDDLAEMMKCFCVAGYMLARHDYQRQDDL